MFNSWDNNYQNNFGCGCNNQNLNQGFDCEKKYINCGCNKCHKKCHEHKFDNCKIIKICSN